MVATPPIYWATQLWGLPDIGDPFDVEEFLAFKIPDDRNAFVFYRQAASSYKFWEPHRKAAGSKADPMVPWSKAVPEVRRWVEENREALALYRRGTERPDALDSLPVAGHGLGDRWDLYQPLNGLLVLALLEGSRLEEQGDLAGAWDWYRADLRAIRHIGMHAMIFRRLVVQRWHTDLRNRLIAWSANPRATPAMLRQALDDVIASGSLAPSETYTLKAEYVNINGMLEGPDHLYPKVPPRWMMNLAASNGARPIVMLLTPRQMLSVYDAWRFWRHEPERSRRVIRLVVANWLAYYDLPPENRPKSDPNPSILYDFYSFGPDAPANARILSPEALDRWQRTAEDALATFRIADLSAVRIGEWTDHRDLLILLGTALYRRDHGTDPSTPEALVGPYLESLPAELPEGGRNEAIPRAGKTVK